MTFRDKMIAWLNARAEAAHKDSDAHPEGSTNRSLYAGQAFAYENASSAAKHAFDGAQDQPPAAGTDRQSPSEVAAVLEAAADHAGASAATYRRLAALMKAPGFGAAMAGAAAGAVRAAVPDIEKALRHAYGRGVDDARQDAGREPLGLAGWLRRRDAWIQQYVARLPGGSDA